MPATKLQMRARPAIMDIIWQIPLHASIALILQIAMPATKLQMRAFPAIVDIIWHLRPRV
jgi:hypothetical protein